MNKDNEHDTPEDIEAEINSQILAHLQTLDPEEWVGKIDHLALNMKKRPKWAKSDQRIEAQVEQIFIDMLKEIVLS